MSENATVAPGRDEVMARAEQHIANLKATFGDTPTWGMVKMAYRLGWEMAHEDD